MCLGRRHNLPLSLKQWATGCFSFADRVRGKADPSHGIQGQLAFTKRWWRAQDGR